MPTASTATAPKAPKAKKATKATAGPSSELDQLVEVFLAKNEKKKLLEKELEGLKKDIEKRIDFEGLTFEEGELKLTTGLIKEVDSAPVLVFKGSGKTLTPADREKVAAYFPEGFRKLDLNTKLISEVYKSNHDVADALNRASADLKEGTSYQIKPLTK